MTSVVTLLQYIGVTVALLLAVFGGLGLSILSLQNNWSADTLAWAIIWWYVLGGATGIASVMVLFSVIIRRP